MLFFFFFNDTATTEIYTLSLHDALPISGQTQASPGSHLSAALPAPAGRRAGPHAGSRRLRHRRRSWPAPRSEEHTSELQSHLNLVCRLLLEKKKTNNIRKRQTQRT